MLSKSSDFLVCDVVSVGDNPVCFARAFALAIVNSVRPCGTPRVVPRTQGHKKVTQRSISVLKKPKFLLGFGQVGADRQTGSMTPIRGQVIKQCVRAVG